MSLILILIAVIIYAIANYNKEAASDDFSWLNFIENHITAIAISALIGLAVYLSPERGLFFDSLFEQYGSMVYVILGFSGQGIFNSISQAINPNTKTKWGKNK